MYYLLVPSILLALASPLWAVLPFSSDSDLVSETIDSGLVPEKRYDEPAKGDSRIYIGGPEGTITLGPDLEIRGGVEVVKKNSFIDGGQAQCGLVDDGAADFLRLRFQTPPGVTQAHCTALVWWPTDFRYGDLLRIVAGSPGGISGSVVSRIILRDADGQFYVSSESITGGHGRQPWGIPNPAAASWTLWDPDPQGWSSNLQTDSFTDYLGREAQITGVGWLAVAEVHEPGGERFGSDVTISELVIETTR